MTKKGEEMAGVYECYASNGYSHKSGRADLIIPNTPITSKEAFTKGCYRKHSNYNSYDQN